MAYKIHESTNAPYINIKFMERGADFDDTSAKVINWNSRENPQWVVSMTHSINGNGQANDLSLDLHHHIDPYINDPKFGYGSYLQEPAFDKDIPYDDPGFLLNLINDAYNTIYFSYGYAQSKDAKTSDINSQNSDMPSSIKIDDDTWFRMYITEVSNSYDTEGITIHITAVSSLVTPDALFGTGEAYDWLVDPDNRVPHGSGCGYGFLLRKIIKYFAKTSNYDVHMSDLMDGVDAAYLKGKYMQIPESTTTTTNTSSSTETDDKQDPPIEIEGAGTNVFQQLADEGNYEFLVRLLDNYITHETSTKSVTYLSNGQNVNTGSTKYHKYYRDWTVIIDDSKQHRDDNPSVTITYQTIVYTRNDLSDLYNAQKQYIFATDEQRQAYYDKYTPFLVESNNDNVAAGALFYNFSSFDRDMLDNYTIDGQNLNKFSNSAFKTMEPVSVCTDIISLDLSTTLIAGLAGFVQNDTSRNGINSNTTTGGAGTSVVDGEGNEVMSVAQNYSIRNSESNIDTYMLGSAMASVQDFAKVLQQLFVSGTVTTPGLGRIITIMSLVNIYVYVSNRLDTTSGKYRVLSQVDTITGGVFTTTLEIMKALTLSGETVYDVASANDANTVAVADTLAQYENLDGSTSAFTTGLTKSITKFIVESNTSLNANVTPIRVEATRGPTSRIVKADKTRTMYVHKSTASKFSMIFTVQIPNADTNGCKEMSLKGCWARTDLLPWSQIHNGHSYTLENLTYNTLSAMDNWEANGENAKSGEVQRYIMSDVRPNNTWVSSGDYGYVIRFKTKLKQDGTENYYFDQATQQPTYIYTYVYVVFPIKLYIED